MTSFNFTAFASPCCTVSINSITESDGKLIVDMSADSHLTERIIRVSVRYRFNSYNVSVLSDTVLFTGNGKYVCEFEGANSILIQGEKYTVTAEFTEECEYRACYGESKTFVCAHGIPKLEIDNYDDTRFLPVGANNAAVFITIPESGFYNLVTQGECEVNYRKYPDNRFVCDEYAYYNEGDLLLLHASTEATEGFSASVMLSRAVLNLVPSFPLNPVGGTICLEMSNQYVLSRVEVSTAGIYDFDVTSDSAEVVLYSDDGNRENTFYENDINKCFLDKGIYYVDTVGIEETFDLTVSYVQPEEFIFDKVYPMSEDTDEFYHIVLESPVEISASVDGVYYYIFGEGKYFDSYYPVIPSGDYYINIRAAGNCPSEFSLNKQEIESIELDTPYIPEFEVDGTYYFAFCAPEKALYEFDMRNFSDYDIYDGYTNTLDYINREMDEGEWIVFESEEASELTVTKCMMEYTELEFDIPLSYDFNTGKIYRYSFTPDCDDTYRIDMGECFISDVKVYTDEEVLLEKSEFYSSFSYNLELKKDKTVYIEFCCDDRSVYSEYTFDIKMTSSKVVLGESTTVSFNSDSDTLMSYTAPDSGYYKFDFSKYTSSSCGVYLSIGKKSYTVSYRYNSTTVYYLEKGETLDISGNVYYGDVSCELEITVEPITPKTINADETVSLVYGEYYVFVPENNGIYNLSVFDDYTYSSVDVFNDESDYLCHRIEKNRYFPAEKGNTYFICSERNRDIVITQEETVISQIGTELEFDEQPVNFVAVDIKEAGYYRINNDVCNKSLYAFSDGSWNSFVREYSSMFKSELGIFYILVASPEEDNEFMDKPYAKLSVEKAQPSDDYYIRIDRAYLTPNYGDPMMDIYIKAPYDREEYNIGFELLDNNGNVTDTIENGVYKPYSDDVFYSVYMFETEPGNTYTIRPYIEKETEDGVELVYGDVKTVTFDIDDRCIPIKYNTSEIYMDAYDKYRHSMNNYYFKFTQPENADSKTYISSQLTGFSLYDDDGYISYDSDENGKYYELEPGKEYCISIDVYESGMNEIYVSSLPDKPEKDNYEIFDAIISGDNVMFNVVVPDESSVTDMFCALYDSDGKLAECVHNKIRTGIQTASFDDISVSDNCKIILVEKGSLKPLGKSMTISVSE